MRLREERRRIHLTQSGLAAIGGVTRSAQGNYESGARSPDAAYLMRVAAAGVDVLYVLTGRRAPVPGGEEESLLSSYHAAPPSLREAALRVLGLEAPPISGHGGIGVIDRGAVAEANAPDP